MSSKQNHFYSRSILLKIDDSKYFIVLISSKWLLTAVAATITWIWWAGKFCGLVGLETALLLIIWRLESLIAATARLLTSKATSLRLRCTAALGSPLLITTRRAALLWSVVLIRRGSRRRGALIGLSLGLMLWRTRFTLLIVTCRWGGVVESALIIWAALLVSLSIIRTVVRVLLCPEALTVVLVIITLSLEFIATWNERMKTRLVKAPAPPA